MPETAPPANVPAPEVSPEEAARVVPPPEIRPYDRGHGASVAKPAGKSRQRSDGPGNTTPIAPPATGVDKDDKVLRHGSRGTKISETFEQELG